VNGALVKGAAGLLKLRRDWGEALIVLRGGDFRGADLRGARIHNICFAGTDLSGSDWRGARGQGLGFLHSELAGAKLSGASLPGVIFVGPQLERVDATGADLSGGVITGNALGTWEGLRLDRADLRGFRFDCGRTQADQCVSYWRAVSFRGADLRGAEIDGFWGDADWRGARLGRTVVSARQLLQLGRARIAGSLTVRERSFEWPSEASVTLSPREYAWLRPHIEPYSQEQEIDDRWPARAESWMAPGTIARFIAPPILLDRTARSSDLYRRLLPVLTVGATSALLVKVKPDRSLEAHGQSVGSNAHACGLAASRLTMDRRTGWYSAPHSPWREDPPRYAGRPMPVLRFRGDRAEVYLHGIPGWGSPDSDPRHSDYVTCGARAWFVPMIRVPISRREALRLWASHRDG
jgi:uncharacterized protein YjbI with pentapeptide repeats